MARRKTQKEDSPVESSSAGNLFDEGRYKALEATLGTLTKKYGEGTIVRLGDAQHMAVDVIPTGSLTTDIALGVGRSTRADRRNLRSRIQW
ncbi:MAG UNVERIFIED_CONTAM: DNA recombination/repair protein RecA [Anaerolineae bacterium]|jgi:recombination protein RecA